MIFKNLFKTHKKEKVSKIEAPKNGIRFASATTDFIFYIVIFLILYIFGGNGFVNTITDYDNNQKIMNSYVYSSSLGNFQNGKFIEIKDDTNSIDNYLNSLEYYYLNWKTGVYNNLIDKNNNLYIENPNTINYLIEFNNKEIDYKYYWFNVNVLKLEDTLNLYDSKEVKDFFIYQNDKNQIAIKNPKYFDDNGKIYLQFQEDITSFFKKEYSKASLDLSNSSFYQNVQKQNEVAEKIEYIVFLLTPLLIIYIIPGLIFTERKTFSRIIYKIGLINMEGKDLSRFSYLLRFVPFLMILLLNYFLNSLIIFIILLTLLFIFNLCLSLFSPNRKGIFDYISNSLYIDDRKISFIKYEKEDK